MPMSPSSLLDAQTGGGTSLKTKTLTDMFLEKNGLQEQAGFMKLHTNADY